MSASDSSVTPSGDAIPPETLKLALKAFKKRIKLTRLDADSKISANPLTGNRWKVEAISPPNQYPRAVWDELAKQGRLKYEGQGMFSLVE